MNARRFNGEQASAILGPPEVAAHGPAGPTCPSNLSSFPHHPAISQARLAVGYHARWPTSPAAITSRWATL